MSIAIEVAFHLKAIRELCIEFEVLRLEVFGSASGGAFDPVESDLDVLVEFPDGYDFGPWGSRITEFEDRLAEIVDRPVDIVVARTFSNPYFARSVERSRRLLYGPPRLPSPRYDQEMSTVPPDERALKLLVDIRTAAQDLVDETEGLSIDDLLRNTRLRLFVERSFEIVGEATRRLRDERPDVFSRLADGPKMIGSRNVIAHGYDDIDYGRLWNAVDVAVPRLLLEVERLVVELDG